MLESEVEEDYESFLASTDRILSGVLYPAFTSMAETLILHAQLHRQARVALHLRLHEFQHGSLPESLAQLPKGISLLKPMGDSPFGYGPAGSGKVLWSFCPSPQARATPVTVPNTSERTSQALNNRSVVWHFSTAGD